MPLLDARDLHKVYDTGHVQLHALRGVSLHVDGGESLAIMGSSGSGKSTLMNILGCLDRPSRGSYQLAGEAIETLDRDRLAELRNRTIGFVFQSFNLLARTNARDNVELPLIYASVPAVERKRRAEAALERVGLGERMHHTPSQLSGGQQQRVAIARALVGEPQLILADEPTGNLDSKTSIEIMSLFGELVASGIALIVVTHEREVAEHAERIVEMRDGQIVHEESGREVAWASSARRSQS
jgi:putative ABC transport system ATP-binding protein